MFICTGVQNYGTLMAATVSATSGLVHSPSSALSPSLEAPLSFAKNRPLFSCLPVFYSVCLSVCASCTLAAAVCAGRAEQRALVQLGRPSVCSFFSCCLPDGQQRMDALWYNFSVGSRRGESSGGRKAESSAACYSEWRRGSHVEREKAVNKPLRINRSYIFCQDTAVHAPLFSRKCNMKHSRQ